jgi:hypothetical protein
MTQKWMRWCNVVGGGHGSETRHWQAGEPGERNLSHFHLVNCKNSGLVNLLVINIDGSVAEWPKDRPHSSKGPYKKKNDLSKSALNSFSEKG